jgi:hypothetical protein
MKVNAGGRLREASTVVRLVLPTSVTSAGPRTMSPRRDSTAMFCEMGAASTIRSALGQGGQIAAADGEARPVAARTSVTSSRSMPITAASGKTRRTANASDPPIRPTPTNPDAPKVPVSASPDWQFLAPPPAHHRLEADRPADGRRDDPQFGHEPIELRREHRLGAVAERACRGRNGLR